MEEPPGGKRAPVKKNVISIDIGKHMKMPCFKFHQSRTINEEFDFFTEEVEEPPGGKGAPINKILSQLFLGNI